MAENNVYSDASTRYTDAVHSIHYNTVEETIDESRFYMKFKSVTKRWFSVDLLTLPLKVTLLLSGGLRGSYFPFLTIFLKSLGLTTFQVGLMNGIRDLAPHLAAIILGGVTDYVGKRKTFVTILCLGTAFFLPPLPFIARAVCPPSNNLYVNASTVFNSTLEGQAVNATLEGGENVAAQPCTDTLVYVLLPLLVLASVFAVPLTGYIDIIVINAVESLNNSYSVESHLSSNSVASDLNSHPAESDVNSNSVESDLNSDKADFGVQKLFYTVGSASATLLTGLWSEHFSYTGLSHYTASFIMPLPLSLLLIPLTCFVISRVNWQRSNDEGAIIRENAELTPTGDTKFQKVRAMFRDFGFLLFMIAVLICGTAQSVNKSFTSLLINDEITSSSTEISLVLATSTISGVFGYLVSSTIVRLSGPMLAITLSILCYFIRFMIMSYTTNIWIMGIIQLLNFQCSAVAQIAMAKFIQEKVPKDVNTTMHSIAKTLFFGVGGFAANVPGGKLYDLFGGRIFFRGVAALCGMWGFLMTAILIINRIRIITPSRRGDSNIEDGIYYIRLR